MQIQSLLYIQYEDSILLINFRKYGCWCCIGGMLGCHGDTLYDTGINAANYLCGITPKITNLRGIFRFEDKVVPKDSSISYVFEAKVSNPTIIKNKELNNAKWVPIKKVLNYKLFPNSERYLLNTYLSEDKFFDLTVEFTKDGINKSLNTW